MSADLSHFAKMLTMYETHLMCIEQAGSAVWLRLWYLKQDYGELEGKAFRMFPILDGHVLAQDSSC